MKKKYVLAHMAARQSAMNAVAEAPSGYEVIISPPKRNLEQNAKFHAICSNLSNSIEFAGSKRTIDEWKVLLVSGHNRMEGSVYQTLAGIEGEVVVLRESTSAMSRDRMSSLIEYSTAFLSTYEQKK